MSRRVQLDRYGDLSVLHIADVPVPEPTGDQILVEVVAAGLNPGEIAIREGRLHERFPATFPSGQGTDFAGRVVAVGPAVTAFAPGDEVLGWSDLRSAQAEHVLSSADHLIPKPPALDWIRAGSLFVVGVTAYAAVRAVAPAAGETVVVSGAAGGVGSITVQLVRQTGARVIAIAGPGRADWLRSVGAEPVAYGDGLAERLRAAAPDGFDAFIDTHGDGYVDLAIGLGIPPDRIDTIIDFEAAGRHGTHSDGSTDASDPAILSTMADHVAWGRIVMPIAAIYPLERLHDASAELALGHTHGKIVLTMGPVPEAPMHAEQAAG
jgi:NADPH:quinone reductase-like Zn-dependent oxidoreductase